MRIPGLTSRARRRSVFGAAAVIALLIAAGVVWWRVRTPRPFQVVERLVDRFEREHRPPSSAVRDAALASTARHRWTADEIDRDWVRIADANGTMFRSPPLDLGTVDDVEALAVTLRAGTERAVLLWNDRPTFASPDYARNRRELQPRADRTVTVVVRGEDIRGDAPAPVRHLFVRLPAAARPSGVIESIAVVTKSELFAAASSGRARVALDGEVRDVLYSRNAPIEIPMDVPRKADLRFGVRVSDRRGSAHARVTLSVGGRTTTVFDCRVDGGSWRDVRAGLPAGRGVIRFAADSDAPGTTVLWSNPLIAAPRLGPGPPNVVLYVVDTLRADRLGFYGAHPSATPFLDALAGESLVFLRCYAAASWTKPSVATLLTGLFPHTHRLGARYYTDSLPDDVPTLQRMLASHGYVTAQFSANAFTGTLSNLDRGFDQTVTPDAFGGAGASGGGNKIGADALNARILPWLEAHAADSFFLYVQSIEPHEPRTVPYEAEVAANDHALHRLYERLSALGLASRTLFVVTSDHGEALGDHLKWGHGLSVHEEEVRVPLIVHWPGTVRPAVVEEPVSLVDLAPTILDYARIGFDTARMQGRSLVPGSHAGQQARPIFTTRFVYPEDLDVKGADHVESHAIVDFPWKLIATDSGPAGAPRFELFNLATDPSERTDRALAEPDRVRRMAGLLTDFLRHQAAARARFAGEHPADEEPRVPTREALEQLRSLGYLR